MSGSSFHVVPDSLFTGSLKFQDLHDGSTRILSGLGSGMGSSKGMAGNDDAGHQFAAKYDPSAQSVSNGLFSTVKQFADIADGLLAMAFNYLQAEQGSNFLVPQVFGGQPELSCRTNQQAVAIPSAQGNAEQSSLPLIGQFWPQGDPVRLRHAAATWRQVAALVEEASSRGAGAVSGVTDANSGQAIDAFAQSWVPVSTLLAQIADVSRKLATAAESYAQQIDDERARIEEIGVTIAVATTAGVLLTVFTLGISDEVVVGGDVALVGAAAEAAATYAVEVAGAGEVAALAGTDAAIEGSILTLPLIAPIAAEAELVGVSAGSLETVATIVPAGVWLFTNGVEDVAAAGYTTPQATTAPGDPLLNGAIPPQPGSPYPMLPPQQQAEAVAWVQGLYSFPENHQAAWADYQRRVAGPNIYEMPTDDGRFVNADGFRPMDGAIIDAKYMDQPSCSPYNLDNRGNPGVYQPMWENAFASTSNEFDKYQHVITDPSNHAQFLEVDVNDPREIPYVQFILAEEHVKGIVRYVP